MDTKTRTIYMIPIKKITSELKDTQTESEGMEKGVSCKWKQTFQEKIERDQINKIRNET